MFRFSLFKTNRGAWRGLAGNRMTSCTSSGYLPRPSAGCGEQPPASDHPALLPEIPPAEKASARLYFPVWRCRKGGLCLMGLMGGFNVCKPCRCPVRAQGQLLLLLP